MLLLNLSGADKPACAFLHLLHFWSHKYNESPCSCSVGTLVTWPQKNIKPVSLCPAFWMWPWLNSLLYLGVRFPLCGRAGRTSYQPYNSPSKSELKDREVFHVVKKKRTQIVICPPNFLVSTCKVVCHQDPLHPPAKSILHSKTPWSSPYGKMTLLEIILLLLLVTSYPTLLPIKIFHFYSSSEHLLCRWDTPIHESLNEVN